MYCQYLSCQRVHYFQKPDKLLFQIMPISGFLSTRKANSGKKSNRGKVIPVNSKNPIRRMWNKIENGCSSCQRSTAVIWSIVGLMLIVVMICLLIVYLKSLEHVAFSSCDKFSSYSLYKRKRAKLLMFEKGLSAKETWI